METWSLLQIHSLMVSLGTLSLSDICSSVVDLEAFRDRVSASSSSVGRWRKAFPRNLCEDLIMATCRHPWMLSETLVSKLVLSGYWRRETSMEFEMFYYHTVVGIWSRQDLDPRLWSLVIRGAVLYIIGNGMQAEQKWSWGCGCAAVFDVQLLYLKECSSQCSLELTPAVTLHWGVHTRASESYIGVGSWVKHQLPGPV